jgi:hypothetical protein
VREVVISSALVLKHIQPALTSLAMILKESEDLEKITLNSLILFLPTLNAASSISEKPI